MTGRTIANRLLEADEDFNVHDEIARLSSTHPGYEVESEGNHWNVYRSGPPSHPGALGRYIGMVQYDDMSDMPKESMSPENIAHWDSHRWYAQWGFREAESGFYTSFDEAVKAVIARPVREGIDDPDIYAHPERYTGQPSEEKIEGALRRMLAPYYTTVTVNKRPGLFAGRGITQRNIPGQPGIEHKIQIHDSFIWTIHCHRDLPLPLPKTHGALEYGEKLDWRKEAESWFKKWAAESGLSLFKFQIAGRLRINPTFQFETARMGPLKEDEDELSPETILASHIDKDAAQEDIVHALWKFHPYGTSYNALLGPRGGFVLASLYFPPEKDDFYKRFEAFVVNWITERKLFPITSTKLTGGKHANSEPYPRWGLTLAINSDWPSDTPPYVPTPVEVGQPGASVA